MKVFTALTFISLIIEVSKFFLKSNTKDGNINKKGLIMKQPEKIERLISVHTRFFKIRKSSRSCYQS